MCGKKATSREHIPPLAIFPDKKDVGETDFRKNLITVPSCDLHNQKKSKDDEFLMASISGVAGNNICGFVQTKTKLYRAFQRNPNLEKSIASNQKDFSIKSENGTELPMALGNPDTKRLIKCFKQISHGIYYHEFNKVFDGVCGVILGGFLKYNDSNINSIQGLMRKKEETYAINWEKKGANPDVFYYQISPPDEFGLISVVLTFFSFTKVYVDFQPNTININNFLLKQLFDNKFEITVNFPDGSKFTFNKGGRTKNRQ